MLTLQTSQLGLIIFKSTFSFVARASKFPTWRKKYEESDVIGKAKHEGQDKNNAKNECHEADRQPWE